VHDVFWDVRYVAGPEYTTFRVDPLFGLALDNIENLFTVRMPVERVAFAGGHDSADQLELVRFDQPGPAKPLARTMWNFFNLGVAPRDKTERFFIHQRVS
jgi:hypothetical protein